MPERPAADPWEPLRGLTQARIGLGRSGSSLPTRRVLEFRAAHAAARDAVHEPLDVDGLVAALGELDLGDVAQVSSCAGSRGEYLRRPDLGRRPAGLSAVPASDADVGIVLADGLSPRALAAHGPGLMAALVERLGATYSVAPPVIATQARVGLGDHVGQAMGVDTLVVVIGERPGLSVADSLGIYLTHRPRPGLSDADRNCLSNIHPPEGMGYDAAASVVTALVAGARELGRSGIALKDSSRAVAAVDGGGA
ncbi:ethanolamine ammonia-lyase subunit EutC [Marmoricola endophyticus]|uniref:ethanolamine ammonia-lyase subunit EutC n=1 Tax=Marmoricola endophyticus TaxID=2040280 RepID=UPI001E4E01A9|nr:ethanolamine ammonia-lyase subunit EutC [Marmoricola endophyticus]